MGNDVESDHWFFAYWRPAMAWTYLFLIIFDFVICPIALGVYAVVTHTPPIIWDPITLRGGAILHASLGGITGITAWSRGQEKICAMQNDTPSKGDDH